MYNSSSISHKASKKKALMNINSVFHSLYTYFFIAPDFLVYIRILSVFNCNYI